MRLPIALGFVSALALMVGGAVAVAKDKTVAPISPEKAPTSTPIKHLVVIFQENRAFDHYFGTYPNAQNVEGEPRFEPAKNTPIDINNLNSNTSLTSANPNLNVANNVAANNNGGQLSTASNPFRLDRTQANTADQSHNYTLEQQADDNGKNDLFPLDVGKGTKGTSGSASQFGNAAQVMGYFDGNTVTALWNYAQNFAMSDAAFTDTFGPSTPGLLNMWAGQTNGAVFTAPAGAKFFDGTLVPSASNPAALNAALLTEGDAVPNADGSLTLIQDIDPTLDVCSSPTTNLTVQMTSPNIGDLLNKANLQWGSFVGGFDLTTVNENGSTGCKLNNPGQTGGRSNFTEAFSGTTNDYVQHHMWFQYFKSTANPTHILPSSINEIGSNGQANHAYDLAEFQKALGAGIFPSVSYIKLPAFQDGHPGNSDPLDEQTGLVNLINMLQQQPDWNDTAVIVTYDDSDGQYDHVAPTITSASFSSADMLNGIGTSACGAVGAQPIGVSGSPVNGRCGPGFRIPFLVISPFAKKNYVSHKLITQASVTKFVEDNWLNGERLGGGSFDANAGSIMDMFDFSQKNARTLVLDPLDGTVDEKSKSKSK
jgi:phospholipase C